MIILYTDDIDFFISNNKSDLIAEIKENGDEPTDEALFDLAYDYITNDSQLLKRQFDAFDNRYKTNKRQYKILIEACLGLWNGTRKAKRVFDKLADCLNFLEDYNTFYFDKRNTTLTLKATHHDGTNYFKIYKIIKGKKRAINYLEI